MPKIDSALVNIEHGFIPLGCKSSTDAPSKFLTFFNHPSGLKVVQSCHGLLLCSSFRDYNFNPNYYIYNPTTKQFVTLPLPANQKTRFEYRMSLVFDPTNSPHYKVVCVRNPDPELDIKNDPDSSYMSQQVEMYSSQTRSRRVSGNPFMAAVNTAFEGGVFCNGAIHWLNTWDTTFYFNVEDEKLGGLPMPPIPDDWEDISCKYFGESRGHLHLIEIYRPRTTMFKVYDIESDYSGWFVKYHIDLDPLTVAFPGMIRTYNDPLDLNYYMFSVLCVVRETHDEESYIVLHIPDKAIQYNLQDGSFKKICDFDPDDENDNPGSPVLISLKYFWAHQFIQTLFCLRPSRGSGTTNMSDEFMCNR